MLARVLWVFEKVTKSRVLRFENEVSFNEIRGCYVVTFSELAPLREKVTNPVLELEATATTEGGWPERKRDPETSQRPKATFAGGSWRF
jgi:hypothetical protein